MGVEGGGPFGPPAQKLDGGSSTFFYTLLHLLTMLAYIRLLKCAMTHVERTKKLPPSLACTQYGLLGVGCAAVLLYGGHTDQLDHTFPCVYCSHTVWDARSGLRRCSCALVQGHTHYGDHTLVELFSPAHLFARSLGC